MSCSAKIALNERAHSNFGFKKKGHQFLKVQLPQGLIRTKESVTKGQQELNT